ncbi:MAG: DNA polymerase Y family protein [Polyangiaceae bacterium]
MTRQSPARRVVCLVLPELACELARWSKVKPPQSNRSTQDSRPIKAVSSNARLVDKPRPLGVVLLDSVSCRANLAELNRNVEPTAKLCAVDALARRFDIERGLSVIEARCLCSQLEVRALPRELLRATLERIAESLLDRASIVSVEPPDTIWLEIGPVVKTFGGEEPLAKELLERVRCLGHRVTLAIADGPRLSQLFARYAVKTHPEGRIISTNATQREVAALPLTTLPLTDEQLGWLGRLGLIRLGDLTRIPEGELIDRLGATSTKWVQLARGEDAEPLVPLVPQRVLNESLEWDEPIDGLERLRFILRRLTTNLEARLNARGEAAERLQVTFFHDRAIAKHRGVPCDTTLRFELSAPLWYAEELERILVLKSEKTQLLAPTVGIEIKIVEPAARIPKQLELSRLIAGFGSQAPAEDGMPLLLAELEGELGNERVGLLSVDFSHRPEKKSLFVPYRLDSDSSTEASPRGKRPGLKKAKLPRIQQELPHLDGFSPLTRLLERPTPIEPPLRVGATLFIGAQAFIIDAVRFEQRLDGVEWWRTHSVSRDYVRLWLRGADGGFEALAYVDRPKGRCFLQAIAD